MESWQTWLLMMWSRQLMTISRSAVFLSLECIYLRNLWKFRMCGDPVGFWRETLWKQRLLGQDSYKAFKSFEGSPNPQKVAQELRQAVQAFKKNMPIIQAWISWIIPVSNDNASQLIVSWWPVMWWLFVYFGGLYCLQLKRWEPVYLAL